MSAYDYEHFVRDFINRTSYNLKVINDIKTEDEKEVYEITQLINSLFGLLIVPYEKYKNISEDELKTRSGYKEISDTINSIKRLDSNYNDDRDKNNNFLVSKFIKHLRNALSHLGGDKVLFIDKDRKLSGALFYDCYRKKDTNEFFEFCVELDLKTLEGLVKNIAEMFVEQEDLSFNEKYHNKICSRYRQFGWKIDE